MNQPHYFVKNHQKFWCSISLARLLRINSIDCWMKKIPTKRSNALTDSDDVREEWEGKKHTHTHISNPIHTPALFPTFHCEWCMDAKVASAFSIVVDVSFWPNLRVRTLFLSLSFFYFLVVSPFIQFPNICIVCTKIQIRIIPVVCSFFSFSFSLLSTHFDQLFMQSQHIWGVILY